MNQRQLLFFVHAHPVHHFNANREPRSAVASIRCGGLQTGSSTSSSMPFPNQRM